MMEGEAGGFRWGRYSVMIVLSVLHQNRMYHCPFLRSWVSCSAWSHWLVDSSATTPIFVDTYMSSSRVFELCSCVDRSQCQMATEDNHLHIQHSLYAWLALLHQMQAFFSSNTQKLFWLGCHCQGSSVAALCVGNLTVSSGTGNLFSGGCSHFQGLEATSRLLTQLPRKDHCTFWYGL